MVELSHCPLCKHQSFSKYLDSKDHFLTEENFQILSCNHCHLRFTNPRPREEDLPLYYKSEEYISHSGVKGGLVNILYHKVRNYTIRQKFRTVKRYSGGNRILDIGCGTGELLNYFKNKGWHATGIEPDAGAREQAQRKYKLEITGLDNLVDDKQNTFDVITMWHVLEHVYDLHPYLDKIKRLLDKNGTFIVAAPNSDSWDARYYKSYWAAYDMPRHLYHFTSESMNRLMLNHQMKLQKIVPMKFDAFYISLLSEKYKTGKQNILRGFLKGLYSNFYASLNKENYSSLVYILKTDNR